jgi:hypothetical protein
MRGAVYAALVATTALLPSGLAAQTPASPEQPPAMTAPPPSPPPAAPAADMAQANAGRRGPANICQELITFLEPSAPAAGAPTAAAPAQSPQAQAAAGAPPPAPAQQTAVAAPPQAPAANTAAQPTGQGAPTQSGISGPIPQANTQGTPGPQAGGQSPAVTKPSPPPAAPAAPAGPAAPKPSPAAVEKAKAAAAGDDIAGCRSAAQEMRRAGVALPPPLIALAGLDLKHHQAAQPR